MRPKKIGRPSRQTFRFAEQGKGWFCHPTSCRGLLKSPPEPTHHKPGCPNMSLTEVIIRSLCSSTNRGMKTHVIA